MAHPLYGDLWRGGDEGIIDGRRLLEMLAEAIDIYSSIGVSVNPSSKLHRAMKAFDEAPSGSISAELYVAVAKLAIEHLSIARMVSQGGYSPASVQTQLTHGLSGGVAWHDDIDRRAESFQFELFVASMMWMAGMRPRFVEPDILVEIGGEKIGIAAKYLFSAKKARKMSIRAVEQIRRSGYRGILACGINLHVPSRVVEGKHREDTGEPLNFASAVPLIVEVDKAAEGERGVIGRIAFIHTAAFQRSGVGGYLRLRMDVRPYLDRFRSGAIEDRDRWKGELQRWQNEWSAAISRMTRG